MSIVAIEPLLRQDLHQKPRLRPKFRVLNPCSLKFSPKPTTRRILRDGGRIFCSHEPPRDIATRASSTDIAVIETSDATDVYFKETFPLTRVEKVKGNIFVRLDHGKHAENLELTVGCNLPGKWILHWGVSYIDDVGSEWDQPPEKMRPPGSVSIKDYAIETPMKISPVDVEGDTYYVVTIECDPSSEIAAINFVLKDEETGAWYQHKRRDFKIPIVENSQDDDNFVGARTGLNLSNMLLKTEVSDYKGPNSNSNSNININIGGSRKENMQLEELYEKLPIFKEVYIENLVTVIVRKCPGTSKNILCLETDLPGDVVVHWGVCRDNTKKWEIPAGSHPPETSTFRKKALRTVLQPKEGGNGCMGLFTLDDDLLGFLFVLKLYDGTWLNCKGNDFYVPLITRNLGTLTSEGQPAEEEEEDSSSTCTDGILTEIRNLVSNIASEKNLKTRTKEAQENILLEIEKLAAEAYSIFRNETAAFSEEVALWHETEVVPEPKAQIPHVKVRSATGTGYEILCQGFNWESHKSGRWYMKLKEKAAELSSLGFTVIWLPPPTDSVSPEGYMPTDLYNLNSRYGTTDELKDIVSTFHEVGMRVLGDAVLNHRCAQYQNQNGVWNIFGGRLNWDDRAVVADDPHFQGRGNKSSGDNFHAAPNIDHSQDFVRRDIKEWLCWLRDEIGYDGWRLDFVRGFWGGYVKDYLDASEPYFALGEYWDSLSYRYGEMEYNQDAHRQRIVDWINATNGTAGAFDVTTKGILHTALERCEYWRLSDAKGKPPGVVGWWPSRAVTFIENHDTGSTQGHWRFPGGKEMQGYAYILTHPGTPSVFYDHIFSHCRSGIEALISLRKRKKLHCRSRVQIIKAERDVYAAITDEMVAMKIGPGHYEPQSGSKQWSLAIDGSDYKVWEAV